MIHIQRQNSQQAVRPRWWHRQEGLGGLVWSNSKTHTHTAICNRHSEGPTDGIYYSHHDLIIQINPAASLFWLLLTKFVPLRCHLKWSVLFLLCFLPMLVLATTMRSTYYPPVSARLMETFYPFLLGLGEGSFSSRKQTTPRKLIWSWNKLAQLFRPLYLTHWVLGVSVCVCERERERVDCFVTWFTNLPLNFTPWPWRQSRVWWGYAEYGSSSYGGPCFRINFYFWGCGVYGERVKGHDKKFWSSSSSMSARSVGYISLAWVGLSIKAGIQRKNTPDSMLTCGAQ